MAKILGIVASNRRVGNGEIMVKAAARAAGLEHTLELLRLPEFKLLSCRACYKCTKPDGKCILDDDLNFIIDKMVKADGIIISTPTYVRGPAAGLKMLGDRVIAIAQHLDEIWQKPTIVICTHGPKGDEGYALSATLALTRMIGLGVKDAHSFLGAMPGEAMQTEGNLERVKQMGGALFGEGRRHQDGECPYCWSNIWKFSRPDLAVCPICLTEGKLSVNNGKITVEYGDSPTQVFGYDWLNDHFRADLAAGVKDFQKKREELKQIKDQYKSDGDIWLKKE